MDTVLTTTLTSPATKEAAAISVERFDDIMRQHQRRVYRVIYLLVRDADTADTLTQECFLRAYQKRASFRGECRIETWLLRIAVNLVRDHGKNRRVSFWKRLVGLDDGEATDPGPRQCPAREPSAERTLLAREELEAVWNALSSLSAQQRTIFFLRYEEEMPLAQIADMLEVNIGTVKTQLSRATGKLREMKERQWK
ncbi:MAG TPA: RNA polymerase sigma factor [Terriglobales bacterium]|nr:RNA polymerase sigma factor [Terriglobales bacterium]